MLLKAIGVVGQEAIFYENIFPAVVAAIVALLGIVAQLIVGTKGNKLVIETITKTKKIESCMQFYRPINIRLNEIIIFWEYHTGFDFDEKKYNSASYYNELKELQDIYSKICKWYSDNYVNMYPENEKLDKLISEIYIHMRTVLYVTEGNPKSWNVLSKYNRQNIISIIISIQTEINKIVYK